jgi:hypothetical protein
MHRRSFLTAAAVVGITGCGGQSGPPAPPQVADHPRPALSTGHHAEHSVSADFAISAEEMWVWFAEGRLMNALQTQGPVARPVAIEPLNLTWPQLGAIRRARLEDGNFVLEEVLESEPQRRFLYQVWGYTSPAAAQIAYGLGEFRIDSKPEGRGIRLTWRYRLRAKAFWAEFFVDRFVRDRFGPFMDNGLARLAAG